MRLMRGLTASTGWRTNRSEGGGAPSVLICVLNAPLTMPPKRFWRFFQHTRHFALKNMEQINRCGERAATRRDDLCYWTFNWRKQGGSQRMIEISKRERFYQQEYCGCVYSLRDTNRWRKKNNRPRIQRACVFMVGPVVGCADRNRIGYIGEEDNIRRCIKLTILTIIHRKIIYCMFFGANNLNSPARRVVFCGAPSVVIRWKICWRRRRYCVPAALKLFWKKKSPDNAPPSVNMILPLAACPI